MEEQVSVMWDLTGHAENGSATRREPPPDVRPLTLATGPHRPCAATGTQPSHRRKSQGDP